VLFRLLSAVIHGQALFPQHDFRPWNVSPWKHTSAIAFISWCPPASAGLFLTLVFSLALLQRHGTQDLWLCHDTLSKILASWYSNVTRAKQPTSVDATTALTPLTLAAPMQAIACGCASTRAIDRHPFYIGCG